jgi:hydroxymethylbilane synthase
MELELATRGSRLARRQASRVTQLLAERRITTTLVEVETTGDQLREELIHRLGTTGAFVRSLDERVLSGELDGSVHSMKDMPTEQPAELVVAAVPERGPAGDVLVTPAGTPLAELPAGATVGTSSLRRGAQLRADRPDLDIVGLRGNVDTRVEKLLAPARQREHERRLEAAGELDGEDTDSTDDAGELDGEDADSTDDAGDETGEDTDSTDDAGDETGEDADSTDDTGDETGGTDDETGETFDRSPQEWFDGLSEVERRALGRDVDTEYNAICLAAAGLERSGLLQQLPVERLDPRSFVPAPAQGAIAVTALDGETADRIHDAIDHPHTRVEVTVERTVLSELGGGCVAPVGVYAGLQGAVVTTTARVLSRDGSEEVCETRELPVERHAEAAADFAADLAAEGATELVERARREEPDDPKRA